MKIDSVTRSGHSVSDPGVTRVGRLLHLTSLDELPQLVNIVRGDMSLVGPLPFIDIDAWPEDELMGLRSTVRPGMTGFSQLVAGSAQSLDEMIRRDAEYARSRSLRGDLALLLRTPVAAVRREQLKRR